MIISYKVIFQFQVVSSSEWEVETRIYDLGVSAPSMFNDVRCSLIRHYFTTFFGLNVHLQVYRFLYFRTLLLTVMRVSFYCCYCFLLFWLCVLRVVSFSFVRFSGCGCLECSFWGGSSAVCWSAIIVVLRAATTRKPKKTRNNHV
jgi:hypothetical protein